MSPLRMTKKPGHCRFRLPDECKGAYAASRRHLRSALAALLMLLVLGVPAFAEDEVLIRLQKADRLRTADPAEFAAAIREADSKSGALSRTAGEFLAYLKAWRNAYDGKYDAAVQVLKELSAGAGDRVLRFRAAVTAANVMTLSARYQDAFVQLNHVLDLLPDIADHDAREQGLSVISYLYNQVGEYELALSYAQRLIDENAGTRGTCSGAQLKSEALYRSTRLQTTDLQYRQSIDICEALGERTYANFVRAYMVRLYMDQGRFDDALGELRAHYDEVKRAGYPRLLSEFDALLAQVYRETGNAALVKQYARAAVEHAVPNQYTEPLVSAYRLLYVLAKEQGDPASALAYHEKYAAADKGYLDDVSARQLAYQRVKHEALSNKLEIDTLNQENQVLQLQRENNRLYIVMLILVLAFIALFAYRTKRSQLHFMKLSRQDGLTGIANRPHFIELAQAVLASAQKAQREVCVILCDLDHFKVINDEHGHAAGDAALREVVTVCRALMRPDDVFGRVGGEEFGILLPGCSLDAARERCEQLRSALAQMVIAYEGRMISVSGSFGVETTASCGYDLRQLLANADAALYQAKHAGRDRVVVYDACAGDMHGSTHTARLRVVRERFSLDPGAGDESRKSSAV